MRGDFLSDVKEYHQAQIMLVVFSPRGDARRAEGLKE